MRLHEAAPKLIIQERVGDKVKVSSYWPVPELTRAKSALGRLHLCLLLLSNLAYFAFILALFLGCQSSMLVTPIQFGLFCIYPCLIFSLSVIYACYPYPIWLILHLSLSYF